MLIPVLEQPPLDLPHKVQFNTRQILLGEEEHRLWDRNQHQLQPLVRAQDHLPRTEVLTPMHLMLFLHLPLQLLPLQTLCLLEVEVEVVGEVQLPLLLSQEVPRQEVCNLETNQEFLLQHNRLLLECQLLLRQLLEVLLADQLRPHLVDLLLALLPLLAPV